MACHDDSLPPLLLSRRSHADADNEHYADPQAVSLHHDEPPSRLPPFILLPSFSDSLLPSSLSTS